MRFIYTKAFAIFAVLLGLLLIITFLEVKGLDAPIKAVFLNAPRPVIAVVQSVTVPVKGFFSTVYGLKGIAQQNTTLKTQVYQLQQKLADYDEFQRENDALKKELGFISTAKQQFVPCSVLVQNPLGLSDTLITNCGEGSGITAGQGVVSQGYLVGKILYVGKNTSTVLLITNSQFSADARMSKSGATAVVMGSFSSGILLDQLSQNEQIQNGDLVVTAGINDQIPKNILIGQIGQVISSQNDLFKKATIISPIDLKNLQFVFIAQ